ncbi:MAG: Ig-like domain-containing protein [Roseburia sp.]|nr:Ig-like domain-containing protein [Roseburia sp.]MCM1096679.1 Ig-like domain-containing protein [Ruminococcus flavefaciens]
MSKVKKMLNMLLALCLCAGLLSGCGERKVEEVRVNQPSITLEEGQSYQLSTKVLPEDAPQEVTFAVSDNGVATVDQEGNITAVSPGEAVVKVMAGDKEASCMITVEAKPVENAPENLPVADAVNGFKPFVPGGLLGGEGGEYYSVTVSPVEDNAVMFSGKGGFSWPDTVNMPVPSAMGGYYDGELALDGLTFTYRLDQEMEFAGDHWYVVALEDRCQLFNSWNGEDPSKTLFIMIGFEEGRVYLQPHYRDVIDLGESWSYLGKSEGVEYAQGDTVTIRLEKAEEGYCIYLNEQLQTFDNINSSYITIIPELFPEEKVWLMAAAHIGNPEDQYEGEYAFTLGLVRD